MRETLKLLNSKLAVESRLLSRRTSLAKVSPKTVHKDILVSDSVLKTNPGIYKMIDLNGEMGVFMKKNYFWVNYKWAIIQNQAVILEIKSK